MPDLLLPQLSGILCSIRVIHPHCVWAAAHETGMRHLNRTAPNGRRLSELSRSTYACSTWPCTSMRGAMASRAQGRSQKLEPPGSALLNTGVKHEYEQC